MESTDAVMQNEKAQRDYQLVLAAREKGDQRAYADLMRFYREPIYLMLLRMTHNPTDADDLTMDTFGKAFCQLHTYTPSNTFATWLFAIASNNGIDYIRRRHLPPPFSRRKSRRSTYFIPAWRAASRCGAAVEAPLQNHCRNALLSRAVVRRDCPKVVHAARYGQDPAAPCPPTAG